MGDDYFWVCANCGAGGTVPVSSWGNPEIDGRIYLEDDLCDPEPWICLECGERIGKVLALGGRS